MLEFINPSDDLKKVNRSIRALKSVIPKDNPKDRGIHRITLNMLLEQRKKLLNERGQNNGTKY